MCVGGGWRDEGVAAPRHSDGLRAVVGPSHGVTRRAAQDPIKQDVSLEKFLVAFGFNAVSSGAFLALFIVLRPRFPWIYSPRARLLECVDPPPNAPVVPVGLLRRNFVASERISPQIFQRATLPGSARSTTSPTQKFSTTQGLTRLCC